MEKRTNNANPSAGEQIDIFSQEVDIDFDYKYKIIHDLQEYFKKGFSNKEIASEFPNLKPSNIPQARKKFYADYGKPYYEEFLKEYFERRSKKFAPQSVSDIKRAIEAGCARKNVLFLSPKKDDMDRICRSLNLYPKITNLKNRKIISLAPESSFSDFEYEEIFRFPMNSGKHQIKECHLSDLKESKLFICSVRFWGDTTDKKKVYSFSLNMYGKKPRDAKFIPFFITSDGEISSIEDTFNVDCFYKKADDIPDDVVILLDYDAIKAIFPGPDDPVLLKRFLCDITDITEYKIWFVKGVAYSAPASNKSTGISQTKKNIRLKPDEHEKLSFFCNIMNIKLSQAVETMICNLFILHAKEPEASHAAEGNVRNFIRFIDKNPLNTAREKTKDINFSPQSADTLSLVDKILDFVSEQNKKNIRVGAIRITENNLYRFVITSSLDSVCGFNDFYTSILNRVKGKPGELAEFWETFFKENYKIDWNTYVKCNTHIPFDVFAERLK